jgi:hypothetical protein
LCRRTDGAPGTANPSIADQTTQNGSRVGGMRVPADRVSVLLLYVNPLLGEGLERLLSAEPRLSVTALHLACTAALSPVIEQDADFLIFEEGGPLGLEQLIERTNSPVVIVISLHSGDVWTLRRGDQRGRSDDVVSEIVATCLGRTDTSGRPAVSRHRRRSIPVPVGPDVAGTPPARTLRPA